MTTIYYSRTFSVRDADSGTVFSDAEFHRCYFEGCAISVTDDPGLRTTARNVKLIDCSQRGCTIYPGVFEDCLVDGLNSHGQMLQSWGAVFNRVVLKGKIDKIMISDDVDTLEEHPEIQRAFDKANADYYAGIDWALDISQAEFREIDLSGVPAHLVRRDPETQVVISRKRVLNVDWENLPFAHQFTPYFIAEVLQSGAESDVFVAPKRGASFRKLLQDVELLRKAGVAEPD